MFQTDKWNYRASSPPKKNKDIQMRKIGLAYLGKKREAGYSKEAITILMVK